MSSDGITLSRQVQNYISDPHLELSGLSTDNLPELAGLPATPLEHGTAYKFRVAAINSCGRGDFSEVRDPFRRIML